MASARTPKPKPTLLDGLVIFVATTTAEKRRDLQEAAKAKGIPIRFEDVRELVAAVHSSDESGDTAVDNAQEKLDELKEPIRMFKQPRYQKVLREYCEKQGIKFDEKRIYFATEDSELAIERELWDKMDKSNIPEDVMARTNRQFKNDTTFGGPGAQLAPVSSSLLGQYHFMNRAFKTINEQLPHRIIDGEKGLTDIKMRDGCVFAMRRLSDDLSAPPLQFRGQSENFMRRADNVNGPTSLEKTPISNYRYAYHRTAEGKIIPCSDTAYVFERSPRAQVVEQISAQLIQKDPLFRKPWSSTHHTQKPHNLAIGLLPPGKQPDARLGKYTSGVGMGSHIFLPESAYHTDFGPPYNSVTQGMLLAEIEETIAGSDAFILLPDTKNELSQEESDLREFKKLFTLNSLVVAKQLVGRDAEKPIIILNRNGCWDKAIALHTQLANLAFTKDFANPPDAKLNTEIEKQNVRIRSNGYFDVLSADGPKAGSRLRNATRYVLARKRETYQQRSAHNGYQPYEHGTAPDDNQQFKVAIFCSASSENIELNEGVKDLTKGLCADGCGIVYGGGDRYTMGAVIDGVQAYRKESGQEAYIAGYSTDTILKAESKHGHFPTGLSYAKKTHDIYERMHDMLKASDAIVVAPGGAGTVQEWTALLMMKKIDPEAFAHKEIIVYNPPLNKEQQRIWSLALTVVMGDEYRAAIEDPTLRDDKFNARLKQLGMHLADTQEQARHIIEGLEQRHTVKLRRQSTGAGQGTGNHFH